ncbi:MAG TPA: glycosyltransferase 87 family protein [Candidatus Binataceae bacterium]|nr:glycosyltransferase 87 family protein [Candidatus Binataceae bacterium]
MVPGIAAGCAFGLLIAWCAAAYSRPLMYRGGGLGVVSLALALIMAAEIAALFYFPGYQNDLNAYRNWASSLAGGGPAGFYPPDYGYHGEYPPAAMYPLWLSGAIGAALRLSRDRLRLPIEIVPVAASFLLAQTLFVFLRRSGFSRAQCWVGAMLAALNPAMAFETVIWGQTDAIVTLLMWLMVLMMLDGRYELSAAMAAAAVLTKPHPLLIAPLMVLWTIWRARPLRWLSAAGSFAAAVAILTAPFQIGRPLDWLPRFYASSLAAFHETSLNAFNFMALTAGLRQSDNGAVAGVSYFAIGMALATCAVLFSIYLLWRSRTPGALMLAAFIALFGDFVFAPRMHERYLFPAMIFLIPAALEQPFMMGMFGAITASWLFNLYYVLNMLRTTRFLPPHDPAAMIAASLNLLLFGAMVTYAAVAPPRAAASERVASASEASREPLAGARRAQAPLSSK